VYEIFPSSLDNTGVVGAGVRCWARIAAPHKDYNEELTLYVSNLPFSCTEADLKLFFGDLEGDIKEIRVAKNPTDGKCRGFAYVEFSNEKSLPAALKKDKKTIKTRPINISMSAPTKPKGGKTPKPNPSQPTQQSGDGEHNSAPKSRLMVPRSLKSIAAKHQDKSENTAPQNDDSVSGEGTIAPLPKKSNDYFKQLVNKGK